MDNKYENIVPWNGANDTGRDVRLKLERNFSRVAANFFELADKDAELEDWINAIVEELKNFLRKDQPDATEYLLKLFGGAWFGEFVDSMIAGKGAGIFPDGRGQFERLEVRGSLSVLDLIINQIQGMESDYSFTEIGKIKSVEDLGESTYRLKIEKRTDFDFMKFQENDVCFSIINTLLTGGSDYYTSWMRILTTNAQENSITVVLYPDSEVPGGTNYPPLAGYNVTRRGNSTLPEAGGFNERAQSWMISSREGRIMFWLTCLNQYWRTTTTQSVSADFPVPRHLKSCRFLRMRQASWHRRSLPRNSTNSTTTAMSFPTR